MALRAADEVELAALWAAEEVVLAAFQADTNALIAAIWADADVQIVASMEETECEIEATTNTSSDNEKLEVQTEISATKTPEDFNTGGSQSANLLTMRS